MSQVQGKDPREGQTGWEEEGTKPVRAKNTSLPKATTEPTTPKPVAQTRPVPPKQTTESTTNGSFDLFSETQRLFGMDFLTMMRKAKIVVPLNYGSFSDEEKTIYLRTMFAVNQELCVFTYNVNSIYSIDRRNALSLFIKTNKPNILHHQRGQNLMETGDSNCVEDTIWIYNCKNTRTSMDRNDSRCYKDEQQWDTAGNLDLQSWSSSGLKNTTRPDHNQQHMQSAHLLPYRRRIQCQTYTLAGRCR